MRQAQIPLSVASATRFTRFSDFYPYYLGEHVNRTCRRLHFIGSTLAVLLVLAAVSTQHWWLIAAAFVQGYGFAWVGHFYFEHNRPATFKHPLYSYLGDWKMWWQTLTGKIAF